MNTITKEILTIFLNKDLNTRLIIDFLLSKKASATVQNIVMDELIKEKRLEKSKKENILIQIARLSEFRTSADPKETNPIMIII